MATIKRIAVNNLRWIDAAVNYKSEEKRYKYNTESQKKKII
jgi:hypothetical protein